MVAAERSRPSPIPWRVVAVDTKQSTEDAARFERIGPVTTTLRDVWTLARPGVVFRPRDTEDTPLVDQVQELAAQAYERGRCTVYLDEYSEVVINSQNAGPALRRVFKQGAGRHVGLYGGTQEPVFVPRQLLSQSTHVFLFDLFYPPDQEVAKDLNPDWVRPTAMGYPHGFYYLHVDGPGDWQFYPDKSQFFAALH